MNLKKIDALADAEMADRRYNPSREPGWILHHGRRTGKIACRLLKLLRLKTDPDTVYVAGLFHDIGKGQDNHHLAGADLSRDLLRDLVPAENLDIICGAISAHNQRKKSKTFSECTKLIQDADLLDHTGHIDIWLSFYWTGHHGQSIEDNIAWFKGKDYRRFRRYMRSHLNYDISRRMLDERLRFSDRFFSDFYRIYFEGR
ncbi:MAG: HD domain-containing protein [Spirochaetia bacterium]